MTTAIKPRRFSLRSPAIASLMLAVAGLATNAHAQAGGGGRILERDLRSPASGGGGLTPRANMMDEVRLRNALITGNVGGLKSFRGNVGYSAPDEFRDRLGSDSSFQFRRDSSSANTLRGISSLQYQTSLSTGNNMRSNNWDGLTSRLGATGSAAASAAPGTADSAAWRTPTFAPRQGTMRSSAAFTANESLKPALVGYTQGVDGVSRITASGLMGVRRERRDIPNITARDAFGNPLGGSQAQANRLAEQGTLPNTSRPGVTPPSLVDPLLARPSEPIAQGNSNNLQQPLARTAYDDLRTRLELSNTARQEREATSTKEGGATTPLPGIRPMPGATSALDARPSAMEDRLAALRERLIPKESRLLDDRGRPIRNRMEEARASVGRDPSAAGNAQANGSQDDTGASGQARGVQREFTPTEIETLEMIRKARAQASTFVDPTTGARDFFGENMARGEDLLSEERYFDAEERFAMALQAKPGDVTAMAARVQAQMGAGLYLSAAFNLRTMLTNNPESAAIRFTGRTVPKPERLRSVAAELRGKVAGAIARKEDPLASDGLLLAYIGWQTEDRSMTEEGLRVARTGTRSQAEVGTIAADESVLFDALEKVWLED